jgi:hypothetical protein
MAFFKSHHQRHNHDLNDREGESLDYHIVITKVAPVSSTPAPLGSTQVSKAKHRISRYLRSKHHIGQQDNSKSDQPQHKLSIFILR